MIKLRNKGLTASVGYRVSVYIYIPSIILNVVWLNRGERISFSVKHVSGDKKFQTGAVRGEEKPNMASYFPSPCNVRAVTS